MQPQWKMTLLTRKVLALWDFIKGKILHEHEICLWSGVRKSIIVSLGYRSVWCIKPWKGGKTADVAWTRKEVTVLKGIKAWYCTFSQRKAQIRVRRWYSYSFSRSKGRISLFPRSAVAQNLHHLSYQGSLSVFAAWFLLPQVHLVLFSRWFIYLSVHRLWFLLQLYTSATQRSSAQKPRVLSYLQPPTLWFAHHILQKVCSAQLLSGSGTVLPNTCCKGKVKDTRSTESAAKQPLAFDSFSEHRFSPKKITESSF